MSMRIRSSLIIVLLASLVPLVGAAGHGSVVKASASSAADKADMTKQAAFQAAIRAEVYDRGTRKFQSPFGREVTTLAATSRPKG